MDRHRDSVDRTAPRWPRLAGHAVPDGLNRESPMKDAHGMSTEQNSAPPRHSTPSSVVTRLCSRLTWEPAPLAPGAFKSPLAVLVTLAFIPRALVFFFGRPYLFHDSNGYRALAHTLIHGDYSDYIGVRTPGYPLMLALFANNVDVTRVVQLLIGLSITILLFFTALRLTGRPWAAFVAGALYGLNLQQIYHESAILSETLATGLLITTVWLITLILVGHSRYVRVQVIALGLACAALVLTRPAFLLVPVVALCAVWPVFSRRIVLICAVLVPSVLLLCAWSMFNWYQIGQFTPSTITGPSLLTHSLTWIPDADAKYADYRDAYAQLRQEQPTIEPTVWALGGAVSNHTHRSLPSVYREMTPLAVSLIAAHPAPYAINVAQGAAWFWRGTGRGSMPWRTASGPLSLAWLGQKLLFFIASGMLFLLCAVVTAICLLGGNRPGSGVRRAWCSISLLVIVACATQALAEFGGNARYGMPLQPLWGLALVVWFSLSLEGWRRHKMD